MLNIVFTNQMKAQARLMKKRGKDFGKLESVLSILADEKPLPAKHRDHALSGKFADLRECHIEPDWLLIYKISKSELVLYATATGTHSDLFKK